MWRLFLYVNSLQERQKKTRKLQSRIGIFSSIFLSFLHFRVFCAIVFCAIHDNVCFYPSVFFVLLLLDALDALVPVAGAMQPPFGDQFISFMLSNVVAVVLCSNILSAFFVVFVYSSQMFYATQCDQFQNNTMQHAAHSTSNSNSISIYWMGE